MSIINSQPLIGASGQGGYFLSKSLRFRSSAGAYLTRTPASAGNRKTWTYSIWLKKTQDISGSNQDLLSAGRPNNPWTAIYLSTGDGVASANTISISTTAGVSPGTTTTAVFRDPSAWYHIVVAMDTTQATASDRVKLWVNNVLQTFSYTNYPSQNSDTYVNSATSHSIGSLSNGGGGNNLDGYLAEVNLIDGQALTPSSFGETSTSTGVWIPKKYTGTYGTNGFYLPFTDVATTSGSNAGLGKDFSGNGNYWTTNNISVTSGSTYDSMSDVPTLTNATTANYCTWNPLNKTSNHTASDGNLTATSSSYGAMASTIGFSSGKWYWEVTCTNRTGTNSPSIGYCNELYNVAGASYLTDTANSGGINSYNGNAATNATSTAYGSAISTNDVVMFAFDADAKKMWVGKNGTWFNSGNPVTATNQYPYTITGSTFFPAINCYTDTYKANFGQQPFAYTPPTGFVALNTFNLPTPTIGATASTQANKYFDATLYTGTGANLSITNAGGFQPDFVWTKSRSSASTHLLFDSIRGVHNYLISATTDAEGSLNTTLTAFNSNGFSVGSNSTINNNGSTNVGWQWKANGSGSTNTAGSITSTVSANTTAGFSIVTYTGNSTAGATVGHGLGVAPNMIIIKSRSNAYNWVVGAKAVDGFSSGKQLYLNTTSALVSTENFFNNTQPTSTVFTVKDNYEVNFSGYTYVAYCFAQVAGYSAFGSYVGNGSADGPFIYTGFRPRYYILKNITSGQSWSVQDTARSPYNVGSAVLLPNSSSAEQTGTDFVDILSNGFKIRHSSSGNNNNNGDTYIYMAFAESPFKYSLGR